jgi:predicted dehydrogenase
MYEVAEKAGVIFEVHQNRRWDEDFLTVKNIVDNQLIGEVYAVESRVIGCNGIPGAWRKEVRRGGGVMLDWGVHLIDQMFNMFPQKAESVYCEYSYVYGEEVEDGFVLTAKLQDSITYRITVLTDCFRSLPRWQVYGTEGTASIDDWEINGGMTTIVKGESNNVKGIKAGNGMTKTMAPRTDNSKCDRPLQIVRAKDFEFYRNFTASVKGQELPYVKKEEVIKVFEFMEACNLSAKLNQVIKNFDKE